ncbi:cysteine--tRNA ligase, partial [Candidatus Bipolaricaulota bacterium]|nr:cysteine--tRNA ligase [Candidatus Bipolaricaulota bacterium]
WEVVYVQNITDVDDKLINRSIETGESVETIAERYTQAYFDLLEQLHAKEPTKSPRATQHIPGMIELIQTLVDKGYAYQRNGDVYYRVSAFKDYGKLSGRRTEELKVGARIAASEKKENPLDFTLWKAAKPGEPKWESPWGEGRPGWHTECVVLSRAFLGETLDIHAGGNDLIFPHHENEIAQAEAATGKLFSRFWLHNGMLAFGGEKMSKSLGNFAYAYQVLEKFGPETVRYFYLSRHYRKPLDYSEDGLEEAAKALGRVQTLIDDVNAEFASAEEEPVAIEPSTTGRTFLDSLGDFRKRYVTEMDDDLNTVGAIASIQELVAEANRFRDSAKGADRMALREVVDLVRELGQPLGLFQRKEPVLKELQDGLVGILVDLRTELRAKKEFALADSIRDRLAELGITLKDTAQGTIWI